MYNIQELNNYFFLKQNNKLMENCKKLPGLLVKKWLPVSLEFVSLCL